MAGEKSIGKNIADWGKAAAAALCGAAARGGARPVNLALQGGGAHGAFTWGVLDRLLEDGGWRIDAVSGASAGAFNAVVLAHGWLDGGPDGARAALKDFWDRLGAKGAFSPLGASLLDQMATGWNLDHIGSHVGFDLFTRLLSPYQFNPLDMNPLRDLLAGTVDFERLRRNRRIRLFIAATEVESGRSRIFETRELTADAVLASATLPWLHHAVEIEGRHYWDGGFTANPPMLPLIRGSRARDLILVRLDSGEEDELPVSARKIHARVNRITMTAPLNRELDTIAELGRLVRDGEMTGGALTARIKALRLHVIEGHKALRPFGQSSKMNAQRPFLRQLFRLGREEAERWLEARRAPAIDEFSTGANPQPCR